MKTLYYSAHLHMYQQKKPNKQPTKEVVGTILSIDTLTVFEEDQVGVGRQCFIQFTLSEL